MKWILGTLLVALVSGFALQPRGEELRKDKLEDAVESILEELLTDKKKLHVGMEIKKAEKAFKNGACLGGEYFLSLEETSLAPKGKWKGTVLTIMDVEEDEVLDLIDVALLCDKYDKGKMGHFLIKAAAKHGVELEQDGDVRTMYYNVNEQERDIWIGLGDGVIGLGVTLNTE